jgi:hypothetical protein
MIKKNLENIIKELELALKENSELIYTNDFQLETKWENETLQHESIELEKRHKLLYNLLIDTIAITKLLKKE